MLILAIDPGTFESAFLIWDTVTRQIGRFGKSPNLQVRELLLSMAYDCLVIEDVTSYGKAVGREVFDTCKWIGRFWETSGVEPDFVSRPRIKAHHCKSASAKADNVRAAMIERFGKPGTAKQPGFTFGITKDIWSAFAIAIWKADQLDPTQGLLRGGG